MLQSMIHGSFNITSNVLQSMIHGSFNITSNVLQSTIHGSFNITNSYVRVCMFPVPVNDIVSNSVDIISRPCSTIGRKSRVVHAMREKHRSNNYLTHCGRVTQICVLTR